jgi:hypothetical protein
MRPVIAWCSRRQWSLDLHRDEPLKARVRREWSVTPSATRKLRPGSSREKAAVARPSRLASWLRSRWAPVGTRASTLRRWCCSDQDGTDDSFEPLCGSCVAVVCCSGELPGGFGSEEAVRSGGQVHDLPGGGPEVEPVQRGADDICEAFCSGAEVVAGRASVVGQGAWRRARVRVREARFPIVLARS